MNIGDHVRTPRFCTVRINEMFDSKTELVEAGYTEPTHYDNGDYEIRGKSLDMYHMVFAACPAGR